MSERFSGTLIVFEGPEGAGKSTQIERLAKRLRTTRGIETVVTREPGHDTELGQKIRKLLLFPEKPLTPEEELNLFIRSRTDHFDRIIIPALEAGQLVLCDRSSPSTIAYQYYGRGLDLTDILTADAKARRNIPFDLIVLLDLDPEIGLARKKPEGQFEMESLAFHKRVRTGYLEQFKRDYDKQWVKINAADDPAVVEIWVWRAVGDLLARLRGSRR